MLNSNSILFHSKLLFIPQKELMIEEDKITIWNPNPYILFSFEIKLFDISFRINSIYYTVIFYFRIFYIFLLIPSLNLAELQIIYNMYCGLFFFIYFWGILFSFPWEIEFSSLQKTIMHFIFSLILHNDSLYIYKMHGQKFNE